MDNAAAANDFTAKFNQLNDQNKRYILAIQQALLFAQNTEKTEKETLLKRDGA